MLEFKQMQIDAGTVKNADVMPISFYGHSKFSDIVTIEVKPLCGCTIGATKFKIAPDERFSVDVALTKRNLGAANSIVFNKTVTVKAIKENNEQEEYKVSFKINVTK